MFVQHTGGRGRESRGREDKSGRDNWGHKKKSNTPHADANAAPDVPLPELPKSEHRYKLQSTASVDEEQAKLRQLTALLNKLTPERFERLASKMLSTELALSSSPTLLRGAISLIFEKAISEPGFVSMYAKLCLVLASNLPPLKVEADSEAFSFKRMLLNTCQHEFERRDNEAVYNAELATVPVEARPEHGTNSLDSLSLLLLAVHSPMFFLPQQSASCECAPWARSSSSASCSSSAWCRRALFATASFV
jgi:hypothetical protein